MIAKNNTKKFISILLILFILMPAVLLANPRKTEASGIPVVDIVHNITSIFNGVTLTTIAGTSISNTGFHIADIAQEILKEAARVAAQLLLKKITSGITDWINIGFHGSPLFLTRPDSFFKDIAKSELKTFVDMTGYDANKFPFGSQIALNTINNYNRQFANNAQYSLSAVINDPVLLKNYRNNFNYGGWNGFLMNTQYPQNNYLGYQMLATQQLAQRLQGTVQNAAQKIQTTLNQGSGFLSPQTCPTNPAYNNGTNEFQKPSLDTAVADFEKSNPYNPPDPIDCGSPGVNDPNANKAFLACTLSNETALNNYKSTRLAQSNQAIAAWSDPKGPNVCPGGLVNTTPGHVAANQITTALGSKFATTELGAAVGGSIAAILDSLANHFIGEGLTALGGLVNPAPPTDNWTFSGVSLGNTTANTTPGNLIIPENVSVDTVTPTSTTISGGTPGYIIQTPPNASIATATINGATLTITGKSKGSTSVAIRDSSATPKTVTVQITVDAPGDLMATPQNIAANVNDTVTTTVSGGIPPYIMITSSNKTIAQSVFAGTTLVAVGIKPGSTLVEIQDSSTPSPKTTTIAIKINGPTDLVVPKNVNLVNITDSTNITVSGGTPPYTIDTQALDTSIATATISGSTITINGVVAGETGIIVQDSSLLPQAAPVHIQVGPVTNGNPFVPVLGTCTANGQQVAVNISEADCTNLHRGRFTANVPLVLGNCVSNPASEPDGIGVITSNLTEAECSAIGNQPGRLPSTWTAYPATPPPIQPGPALEPATPDASAVITDLSAGSVLPGDGLVVYAPVVTSGLQGFKGNHARAVFKSSDGTQVKTGAPDNSCHNTSTLLCIAIATAPQLPAGNYTVRLEHDAPEVCNAVSTGIGHCWVPNANTGVVSLDPTITDANCTGGDFLINPLDCHVPNVIFTNSLPIVILGTANSTAGTPPIASLGHCVTGNSSDSNVTADICVALGGTFTLNLPAVNGIPLGSCNEANGTQDSNVTANICESVGGTFTANQ